MKKLILVILLVVYSLGYAKDFKFDFNGGDIYVNSETLEVVYKLGEDRYIISKGEPRDEKPIRIIGSKGILKLEYLKGSVVFKVLEDRLRVSVVERELRFPIIEDENIREYYLPIGHGKRIPVGDSEFVSEYEGSREKGSEFFTMSTFTSVYSNLGVVYYYDNIANNYIDIYEKDKRFNFSLSHVPTKITKNPNINFDIHITKGSLVESTSIYKNKKTPRLLEEKALENKDIKKLYGASHFYIWGSGLRERNVRDFSNFIGRFVENYRSGSALEKEIIEVFFKGEVEDKRSLVDRWKEILSKDKHYRYELVGLLEILNYSFLNMEDRKKYEFAKKYEKYVGSPSRWGDGVSKDMIDEMYKSGIDRAWLGVDSVEDGRRGKGVIEYAVSKGYLVAPYDSYHSIHDPKNPLWETADFEDNTLFEEASIKDEKNRYLSGFLGRGRKLNPRYSYKSVRYRLSKGKDIAYNSWFIDVDGTGEIHDDFSKGTDELEDLRGRQERIAIVREEYNKVVGTEGGNDLIVDDVAFAHGIYRTPFGWGDKDMMKDRESKYFTGSYYSGSDNIPPRYSKVIPIKSRYHHVYYDNRYNIPMYQLVYNNVIITTNHWEWDTLKVESETNNLLLRGLLYNVPPMYHLDQKRWNKNKDLIVRYNDIFSPLHRKLIGEEMIGYRYLNSSKTLQETRYSNGTIIRVNFSDEKIVIGGRSYLPKSAMIIEDKDEKVFVLEIKNR